MAQQMRRGSDAVKRVFTSDRPSDNTAQYLQQRITGIDKSLAAMRDDLAMMLRKMNSLNSRSEQFVQHMLQYAERETPGIRACCHGLGNCLKEVNDARDQARGRLEARVFAPLKGYQMHCKIAKDELRHREESKRKEVKRRRRLSELQMREPDNREKIQKAKLDLAGATTEATHANQALLEQMDKFEAKKVKDMRQIYADLVRTQMEYHARALTVLSDAYHAVEAINEEEDMYDMREMLKRSRDERERDLNNTHGGRAGRDDDVSLGASLGRNLSRNNSMGSLRGGGAGAGGNSDRNRSRESLVSFGHESSDDSYYGGDGIRAY